MHAVFIGGNPPPNTPVRYDSHKFNSYYPHFNQFNPCRSSYYHQHFGQWRSTQFNQHYQTYLPYLPYCQFNSHYYWFGNDRQFPHAKCHCLDLRYSKPLFINENHFIPIVQHDNIDQMKEKPKCHLHHRHRNHKRSRNCNHKQFNSFKQSFHEQPKCEQNHHCHHNHQHHRECESKEQFWVPKNHRRHHRSSIMDYYYNQFNRNGCFDNFEEWIRFKGMRRMVNMRRMIQQRNQMFPLNSYRKLNQIQRKNHMTHINRRWRQFNQMRRMRLNRRMNQMQRLRRFNQKNPMMIDNKKWIQYQRMRRFMIWKRIMKRKKQLNQFHQMKIQQMKPRFQNSYNPSYSYSF
ncbi:hypothetical protein M9Y10_041161 [Tritrichomonas musculus]|uniref:Uncharacterized protein n=1 Tax=Tritrichomonas musculus TaxID=1915356 RepID=A0ABR2K3P0_9EUKA